MKPGIIILIMMKFITLLFVGLLGNINSIQGITEENHIIVLDNTNFEGYIKDNERVLVKFYTPWCDKSKILAPIYSKLG